MLEPAFAALAERLKEKNIRLTHQRLKVLEYLMHHRGHPTADEIHGGLLGEIPTLSKTTVYNTLNALAEANLINALSIEDHETRYEIADGVHGHFKCVSCGEIRDFGVDIGQFVPEELAGFKITGRDVYFKGVCPECL